MPPHDHSACEVVIGPDSIVVLVAAGRGDQDRVDLEFHPVDRVTCEIGGRAWPPREELRFAPPLATTPDVLQEHAQVASSSTPSVRRRVNAAKSGSLPASATSV